MPIAGRQNDNALCRTHVENAENRLVAVLANENHRVVLQFDADVLLVDGVRSVDWITKVRGVIGDKPLLFNQIAGGKSPRLSLTELEDLGVDVAIYSTPCLFAAHTAIDNALLELRANDGRLPEVKAGDVGVAASIDLLERNISRNHPKLDRVDV